MEKIDPIQYFKDLLRLFEDKSDEFYWGKVHNATSRDMIQQAISALERQEKEPFCEKCKYFYCFSAVDRMFSCKHHHGLRNINVVDNKPYCSYFEELEG